MIIKEFFKTREDGANLYRSYSNEGYLIRKVGTDELYSEAIDIEDAPYIYEQTDIEDFGEEITAEEFLSMVEEVL